jgi:primosomal protein N' (replication factor Y) (superfamily II helicase)
MTLYADVALPLPVDRPYTYSVPPELVARVQVGSRVLIPLGKRWITGFVVGLRRRKPEPELKLKPIAELLDDEPLFSPAILSFTLRLSRSCLTPWGEVLQAAVPPSMLPRTRTSVSLTPEGEEALERGTLSSEERLLATLLKTRSHSPRFLQKESQVKNLSAFLARMQKKGLVIVEKELKRVSRREPVRPSAEPAQLELDFALGEGLRQAAGAILDVMTKEIFSPFLLFGPAGRREAVYFHLIREAMARSGRVLFLVPEISLTPALTEKYKRRLGDGLAVLHSRMTDRQRELEWVKIRERRAEVVIGPRSALFAPLFDLRLIILDEEQDETYAQQEGQPFDVRKAARIRAQEEKAAFVQGSAAPTVESFYAARKGRSLIDLGRERGAAKGVLLDFRRASGLVDPRLKKAIRARLEKKEQVILFFNRRGYASLLVCSQCRYVPNCDRCDLSLAYHKKEGKLVCHVCRSSVPAVLTCPRCGGRLIPKLSAGVEAVAEELKTAFPGNRVEVFAVDEATRKEKRDALLKGFEKKEIDILVGTQLLAHQPGLPPVKLAAVLHPEMVLHLADFRSGQKAFLMIRSAFRFLADGARGEVLIQTSAPDHYSIREGADGDYGSFFEQEIKFRRLLDYPPFCSLAQVLFTGENARRVAASARMFVSRVKESGKDVQVLGPSVASMARKRGLFRVQVNLKTRRLGTLIEILGPSLKGIRSGKSVFLFP